MPICTFDLLGSGVLIMKMIEEYKRRLPPERSTGRTLPDDLPLRRLLPDYNPFAERQLDQVCRKCHAIFRRWLQTTGYCLDDINEK